ncbi:hypothetical protein B0H17DRAFT_1186763 [Mycena rosella]|uniref:DUF7053 domain-containing protein n=1 Tax=Mycena rosella TaxID=1033263 RepID=A0AAD7CGU4_MYCRO|nr:hypothetical protein B0H17DRAFT_1186763 [Mycena rosella]
MRFQFAFVALAISASALPVTRGIFDKTSIITSTKHINAPVEDVIATLHDFQKMINLNPLVTSSVPDPTDPNTISVTDKLPLFLGLSVPTTYTAKFEAVADGMNTNNTASAGVLLHNEWRAVANASGGTDLTETDTLTLTKRQANFLLSPIVTSELQTSHNQLMNTLASQLETAAAAAAPAATATVQG